MIYLKHIYQQSGLPEPDSILINIKDTPLMLRETVDEISSSFPKAQVQLAPPASNCADLIVLAYRDSLTNFVAKLKWAITVFDKAKYGVAFFCLDQRNFVIVPSRQTSRWALREVVVSTSTTLLVVCAKIIRRLLRIGRVI
jgi:hypothetical protein